MKVRVSSALTLMIIIVTLCTGCVIYDVYQDIQENKKLPLVEYCSDGSIIYDGYIYKEYCFSNTSFSFTFEDAEPIAKSSNDYFANVVYACGKKDFGENVYIVIDYFEISKREYLRSDFQFPDYMNTQISKLFLTSKPEELEGNNILQCMGEHNLYLSDILTEVALEEINNVESSEIWANIYFSNYQTFYLRHPSLFVLDNEIFIEIHSIDSNNNPTKRVYRINDEYRDLFKNAIAELSE